MANELASQDVVHETLPFPPDGFQAEPVLAPTEKAAQRGDQPHECGKGKSAMRRHRIAVRAGGQVKACPRCFPPLHANRRGRPNDRLGLISATISKHSEKLSWKNR